MSLAHQSYDLPAEYKEFLQEFETLVKKYPGVAGQMSLMEPDGGEAAAGSAAPLAKKRLIIWECNWFGGFPDCRPVIREQ